MAGNDARAMDRRKFFGAVGGASSVAVAAAVTPLTATVAEAYDPGAEESKARYRESEHVKTFYRTVGYETLKK